MKYSSGIISVSLWYLETKTAAKYLIEGLSRKELVVLSLEENIFQANSERRAKEMANLFYRRLNGFSDELLEYLVNANSNSGKLLVLISILKEDKLFFEFMYEVFREHIILGNYTLKQPDYDIFFRNKMNQSKVIENWTDITIRKLKAIYKSFLSEVGLLNTDSEEDVIIVPFLDYRLKNLLEENNYGPLIKAITGEN